MDRPPQSTRTFPMDDAYLENAFFPTGGEVIWHQFFYVARVKRMQV